MKDDVIQKDFGMLYAIVTVQEQPGLWSVVDAHEGYTVESLDGSRRLVVPRRFVASVSRRRLINRYRNLSPKLALADMILNERERAKGKLIRRVKSQVLGINTDYRSTKSDRDSATRNNNSKAI